MNILQAILTLLPQGINITIEILKLIQQAEGVVNTIPPPQQAAVNDVIAKALVTKI